MSSWLDDARVIRALLFARRRGDTLAERLDAFYRPQAELYDAFRERLLPGRRELIARLPWDELRGGTWVDLGGGTGANLEFAGRARERLGEVHLVDLCPSLLAVAARRVAAQHWSNVTCHEYDALTFRPPRGHADLVTFSYSLTMMPEWAATLEHALSWLRPGGILGAVDFHVSRKQESEGRERHGWWTRTCWPIWFAFDDVFLSSEHLPMLMRRLSGLSLEQRTHRPPYFPFGAVPYYVFVGRQRTPPPPGAAQ